MPIVQLGETKHHMDGYLQANLDLVKHSVTKQNFDCFLIVTGREGYGKSTLAGQIAKYLDPTYNLDRCCFTADQFEDACESANKYQAIVFDETMGYLSSRGAMSHFNRKLIKIMAEMRSKNLFVILCIPNFFELDRYPAMHRSTGMLHVYQRGKYGMYDYEKKKKLYLFGKKGYSYSVPPLFIGKFVTHFVLDQQEYEKKKQASIKEWLTGNNKEKKLEHQRNILLKFLYEKEYNITQQQLADLLGVTHQYVSFLLENLKISSK